MAMSVEGVLAVLETISQELLRISVQLGWGGVKTSERFADSLSPVTTALSLLDHAHSQARARRILVKTLLLNEGGRGSFNQIRLALLQIISLPAYSWTGSMQIVFLERALALIP